MRCRLPWCILLLPAFAAAPATQPATRPAPPLEAPTPQRPVTGFMWLETESIQPDADIDLHIRIRIAPGHWLYGRTDPTSPFTPLKIKLKPDTAIREASSIEQPTPDAKGHLIGDIQFRQRLHISPNITPGSHTLSCELTYQACNSDLCWPPQTIQLKTDFEVSAHQRSPR